MAAPLNLAAAARARKVDAHPTSHRSFFSRVQYAPRAATSLGILLGRAPGRTREAPPQRFHVRSSFQQAQGVTASVFSRAEPPPASTRGRHKRFFLPRAAASRKHLGAAASVFIHAGQPRASSRGCRTRILMRGAAPSNPQRPSHCVFARVAQPRARPRGRRSGASACPASPQRPPRAW